MPEAYVIVGSKRVETARIAVEKYGCDLILLDDGMQHMQLARDCDMVLFDYNDDPNRLKVLPAGRLREQISHLKRARIIVVTKIPNQIDDKVKKNLAALSRSLQNIAPQAVLHYAAFAPCAWRQKGPSAPLSLSALAGKSALAVSGIARPESFLANLSLAEVDIKTKGSISVGDHHWFSAGDIDRIVKVYRESGADLIVTTEKDLVRLDLPEEQAKSLYALTITPRWLDIEGRDAAAPDFGLLFDRARDGVSC